MGWLGVLVDTAKREDDPFRVPACHLNWWTLPTLIPGRRLFVLDIGLHVVASEHKEVSQFILALPVQIERVRWAGKEPTWVQDLYEVVQQSDVCAQVFGERVEIHSTQVGYRIHFPGGSDLEVGRILAGDVAPLDGSWKSRSDLSIWRIPLESAIPPNESRYVRFRVSVFTAGTVWHWKRSWSGKAGAQVDLRVADVREALREERERQYWQRVVPIESLNVFFMVPPAFQARITSPALHYVRLLEAGQWGSYLRGVRCRLPIRGLRVHYWRHPAHATANANEGSSLVQSSEATGDGSRVSVTIDEPYRVFLDLSRDISPPAWVSVMRMILAVIIGLILVRLVATVSSVRVSGHLHVRTTLVWILGGSVLAIVTSLTAAVRIVAGRFRTARIWLRKVERALLKPFARF